MDSTRPKPFVFVLMPFAAEFDDTYRLGIRPACEDAGAYCERLDDQIFTESMLERIYNQISKADLIVADMTGRNPNVFYEVGYAHALGKRVILLTQKSEDIPFDLKHYPHIVYSGRISYLKDELGRRISLLLRDDEKSVRAVEAHRVIQCYLEGQPVSDGTTITIPFRTSKYGVTYLEDFGVLRLNWIVALYNPTDKLIELDFRLGLIFPNHYPVHDTLGHSDTQLPDGRYLITWRCDGTELLPQLSVPHTFALETPARERSPGEEIPLLFRFFLRYGVEDIAITLKTPDRWHA